MLSSYFQKSLLLIISVILLDLNDVQGILRSNGHTHEKSVPRSNFRRSAPRWRSTGSAHVMSPRMRRQPMPMDYEEEPEDSVVVLPRYRHAYPPAQQTYPSSYSPSSRYVDDQEDEDLPSYYGRRAYLASNDPYGRSGMSPSPRRRFPSAEGGRSYNPRRRYPSFGSYRNTGSRGYSGLGQRRPYPSYGTYPSAGRVDKFRPLGMTSRRFPRESKSNGGQFSFKAYFPGLELPNSDSTSRLKRDSNVANEPKYYAEPEDSELTSAEAAYSRPVRSQRTDSDTFNEFRNPVNYPTAEEIPEEFVQTGAKDQTVNYPTADENSEEFIIQSAFKATSSNDRQVNSPNLNEKPEEFAERGFKGTRSNDPPVNYPAFEESPEEFAGSTFKETGSKDHPLNYPNFEEKPEIFVQRAFKETGLKDRRVNYPNLKENPEEFVQSAFKEVSSKNQPADEKPEEFIPNAFEVRNSKDLEAWIDAGREPVFEILETATDRRPVTVYFDGAGSKPGRPYEYPDYQEDLGMGQVQAKSKAKPVLTHTSTQVWPSKSTQITSPTSTQVSPKFKPIRSKPKRTMPIIVDMPDASQARAEAETESTVPVFHDFTKLFQAITREGGLTMFQPIPGPVLPSTTPMSYEKANRGDSLVEAYDPVPSTPKPSPKTLQKADSVVYAVETHDPLAATHQITLEEFLAHQNAPINATDPASEHTVRNVQVDIAETKTPTESMLKPNTASKEELVIVPSRAEPSFPIAERSADFPSSTEKFGAVTSPTVSNTSEIITASETAAAIAPIGPISSEQGNPATQLTEYLNSFPGPESDLTPGSIPSAAFVPAHADVEESGSSRKFKRSLNGGADPRARIMSMFEGDSGVFQEKSPEMERRTFICSVNTPLGRQTCEATCHQKQMSMICTGPTCSCFKPSDDHLADNEKNSGKCGPNTNFGRAACRDICIGPNDSISCSEVNCYCNRHRNVNKGTPLMDGMGRLIGGDLRQFFYCGPANGINKCSDICRGWGHVSCGELSCYCDRGGS